MLPSESPRVLTIVHAHTRPRAIVALAGCQDHRRSAHRIGQVRPTEGHDVRLVKVDEPRLSGELPCSYKLLECADDILLYIILTVERRGRKTVLRGVCPACRNSHSDGEGHLFYEDPAFVCHEGNASLCSYRTLSCPSSYARLRWWRLSTSAAATPAPLQISTTMRWSSKIVAAFSRRPTCSNSAGSRSRPTAFPLAVVCTTVQYVAIVCTASPTSATVGSATSAADEV